MIAVCSLRDGNRNRRLTLMIRTVRHLSNSPEEQKDKRDPQRKALLKGGHMSEEESHNFTESLPGYSSRSYWFLCSGFYSNFFIVANE